MWMGIVSSFHIISSSVATQLALADLLRVVAIVIVDVVL